MSRRPDPRGAPDPARLTQDVERIVRVVERETGLNSRWNGLVRIVTDSDAPYLGRKLPDCPIEIHADVIGDVEMYYVALEEAVHSVSVLLPAEGASVVHLTVVEETIVSGCIELLKPALRREFASLPGALLPDSEYLSPETLRLEALGQLRRRAGQDLEAFYFGLLSTPLADRLALIVRWIARNEVRDPEIVAQEPAVMALIDRIRED